jgi:hypothetical protein
MSLSGVGKKDVDGRDKTGHEEESLSVILVSGL